MSKLRVGVLRGGPSSEYDISLKTGGHVLQNLSPEMYIPQDIFISRDGMWHMRGFETPPEKVLKNVDVVFNALHGEYGEDGSVQRILDAFQVPYTGSGTLASKLAMNKPSVKGIVSNAGIRTPLHKIIERTPDIEAVITEIFRTFPQPVVIKPLDKGSSEGVVFAGSYQELIDGITKSLEEFSSVLIEEFIKGKEVTSGVIEDFRGEDRYTLLPIEIVLPYGKTCFDYDAKYNGESELHCPGSLTAEEKLLIRDATRTVHDALGLRHYSRSDFIVTPRGVYFLEANTLPGLTEGSLVPHALNEVGCSFPEFLDHLISLAVNRK
ncbi:D-alanine--D-alanine ligase [Candidatus Kaiserbacteria bacterium]|nr:D-alanine--D-alanine ligase [Candidatus Kaiserbacteria bacterium]